MTEIVRLDGVGHLFAGRGSAAPSRALHPLSFSLHESRSLALVGESGSGKTTLLRLILGLEEPTEGTVSLFGTDPAAPGEDALRARRRCGYVPQDPFGGLPPTLSVLDTAAEPLLLPGSTVDGTLARRQARELLRLCLLEESLWTARAGMSLSGGQRQRVCLARALVPDPDLLLADEPTSMQDSQTRRHLVELLQARSARGKTLLFVTHDLVLARAVTERAVVLLRGRIVEEGPTGDLLSRAIHPYTRALAAALPRLGQPLAVPPPALGPAPPGSCPFVDRCPHRMPACASAPPLRTVSEGHRTACWLYAIPSALPLKKD